MDSQFISLKEVKQYFGDQIRALSGLHGKLGSDRVIAAFSSVPREEYAGKGPWRIMSPLTGVFQNTCDAHPKHLYHSVLISLDEALGINIGEPTLWAKIFAYLQINHGSHILQIGAGSGYYSAILANLVGAEGKVIAFEVNDWIANIGSKAASNIANLDIKIGDATGDLLDSNLKFDFIIAFAGVTHPVKSWLNALADNGVLLLPITGSNGWGAICALKKISSNSFVCETLGSCGFYQCNGARNGYLATQLDMVWSDQKKLSGCIFTMNYDANGLQYEFEGKILRSSFD